MTSLKTAANLFTREYNFISKYIKSKDVNINKKKALVSSPLIYITYYNIKEYKMVKIYFYTFVFIASIFLHFRVIKFSLVNL